MAVPFYIQKNRTFLILIIVKNNDFWYKNKGDGVLRNKIKKRTFYRKIFIILFIEKVIYFCYYNI